MKLSNRNRRIAKRKDQCGKMAPPSKYALKRRREASTLQDLADKYSKGRDDHDETP